MQHDDEKSERLSERYGERLYKPLISLNSFTDAAFSVFE
jgi:hypothetical protein